MTVEEYYPYSVNIELTLACNLRCLHCGSTAGKARRDELSGQEFRKLFKGLRRLGCVEVCLLGGEPFVRKDWYEIASDCAQEGIRLIFITNGFNFNKSVLRKIRKLKSVIDRIGVSIDGARASTHDMIRGREGAFLRAWNAAKAIRDEGIETGIITTVSKLNFGEIEMMMEQIAGQNFTWQLQSAAPQGARFDTECVLSYEEFYRIGMLITKWRSTIGVEQLPVCGSHDFGYFSGYLSNYSELPRWHGCGAGLWTLGIMSDGRVKGCLAQNDDFVEDSVRNRSIEQIWTDERLFARNRRFVPQLLEGFCGRCPYGQECRAGCSNLSYNITGSTYNNPYCFYRIEQAGIVDGYLEELEHLKKLASNGKERTRASNDKNYRSKGKGVRRV